MTPATSRPSTFRPSWEAEPAISAAEPMATPRARLPAAGTVVTEMKTPTIALVLSVVWAHTPAAPASRATTKDQMSGRQMKPVWGRARVTSSGVKAPACRAAKAATATTAVTRAKLQTSSHRARPASRHRPSTAPVHAAATTEKSGPTTIAPTTSTAESVSTAIPARATAMSRNTR
ncbi:Uncharacterised protein [Mycobacteroides abscessus subsp. abscessus]|nr:Uncharacterised protein [Mycobacteroides abscessus subsp. abscessus]